MIRAAARFLRRHSQVHWALVDQALVSGVSFLTGVILAHGLGVAEFGRFSLAWLAVLFVQSIQENAIIAPMMSLGPKQDFNQQPGFFGSVFLQQAVFASLSTLATWLCFHFAAAAFGDGRNAALALPLAAAVLLTQSQEFLRRYFFTLQLPAMAFISDVTRYVAQVAMLFWTLIVAKGVHDIGSALWVIAGASAAGGLVVVAFVVKMEWTTAGLRSTSRSNWRSSRWLVGSAVLQWMGGNAFVLAAGALLGVAAVGALKAAQSLIGVTHILFQGLENVAPIRAAKHYCSGGAADLALYLAKVTRYGFGATATIGLVFAIVPEFWLRMFGESFSHYGFLVRWYAALYVVMFLMVPLRIGLRAVERTAPIFVAYTLAATLSVATAFPLVRMFGLNGVLFGMISIQLIQGVVMLVAHRRALATG